MSPEHGAPLQLEIECDRCRGEGEVPCEIYGESRRQRCEQCQGFGRLPTAFGESVLAFVIDRLKLGQREMR